MDERNLFAVAEQTAAIAYAVFRFARRMHWSRPATGACSRMQRRERQLWPHDLRRARRDRACGRLRGAEVQAACALQLRQPNHHAVRSVPAGSVRVLWRSRGPTPPAPRAKSVEPNLSALLPIRSRAGRSPRGRPSKSGRCPAPAQCEPKTSTRSAYCGVSSRCSGSSWFCWRSDTGCGGPRRSTTIRAPCLLPWRLRLRSRRARRRRRNRRRRARPRNRIAFRPTPISTARAASRSRDLCACRTGRASSALESPRSHSAGATIRAPRVAPSVVVVRRAPAVRRWPRRPPIRRSLHLPKNPVAGVHPRGRVARGGARGRGL